MASFRIAELFLPGTNVVAYPSRSFAPSPPRPGQAPPGGPPTASAVADAESVVQLSGLTVGTLYFIGAQVNGQYRWIGIQPVAESTGSGETAVLQEALTAEAAQRLAADAQIAGLLSAQSTQELAVEARLAVLEARLGGLAGAGQPQAVTSALVGATHTPEAMTLKGEVNPEGATTKWFFEYGETVALGTSTSKETLGFTDNASHAVSQALSAVSPGSLTAGLFFRLVAENSNGVARGAIMQPSPAITMRPTVAYGTTPATNIASTGFTGNAVVNPNGEETTVTLEWGTTTGYGTTKVLAEKPSGRTPVNVSVVGGGSLVAGTTYHYRLKAVNGSGTTNLEDRTFTFGALNEVLIGDQTAYTVEAHVSKGRIETIPFTVKKTGNLEKLKFKTKEAAVDEGTLTEVRMAVIKDDGTGKPAVEAVLAEGATTAAAIKEAEKELEVTLGSPLAVTAGEKLWIAVLPIGGGKIHFHASAASGATPTFESAFGEAAHTACNQAKAWESNGSQAPMLIWGVGATTTVGSSAPALTLSGGKEAAEWASIGAETEYEVRVSEQPVTVSGRTAAVVTQALTANPQRFVPKANTSYGLSPTVTLAPGQTAYIEARVVGSATWSNAVGIPIATEAVTTLKGINAGGWNEAQEVGDYEEAGINVIRLNKPSAARVAQLEGKGIKVVYLYYGDVGGYNSGGVKAINRVSWVADAISRIKEVKPAFFEVLNEPTQIFWGSEANTQENAAAYVELLKLFYTELVAKVPSGERPKVLASMDGGASTSKNWVEKMKAANASFASYFDQGTVHPYYKVGGNATGKLGNRGNVESIFAYMGGSKPVAITEVGWPTIVETGDSYKYSEAEQAEAVAGFLAFAKASGKVSLVTVYNYRDGSDKKGYGLWNENDSPKSAVARVAAA